MKWFLAGLMFAAFVAIALFTATVRANNALRRHELELEYRSVRDREIELERLEAQLLDSATAERLARAHEHWLMAEYERRQRGWQ